MRAFLKTAVASALLGTCLMASAQSVTYTAAPVGTYTNITNFVPACSIAPCLDYTTAMAPSGSFTVATRLPASFSGDVSAQLTGYSFSDGLNTYARTDPEVRIRAFNVTTDGTGAITSATITLQRWIDPASHFAGARISLAEFGVPGGAIQNNFMCIAHDTVTDSCDLTLADSSSSSQAQGVALTWSSPPPVVVAPAAVPSTSVWGLALLSALLGMAGLATARSRRQG
ncbi:MAG: IPTL-CTERM sorting domain-containing protein [Burkholderiaceae bacterium]|nr:IPTL-CTERM sorting domain-containing protein [Burkholderiaceae bacterium]